MEQVDVGSSNVLHGPTGRLKYTPQVDQWGSSPWGDSNAQPGASRWTDSPFDAPEVRQEAPPVFGASPGFPTYPAPPQTQGWAQPPQPGYGYPAQFTPQPSPRRRGKVIGIVVAAVVVVLALVIGSVVVWKFSPGGSDTDADTTAGKAEVASAEARPPAEIKVPSLSAAPTGVLWSYPPGGDSGGYPDVVGGDSKTVFVKLRDSLIGLDAANGSQMWQQPSPQSIGPYPYCVVSTSGNAGLCSGIKDAVVLDMKTGTAKDTLSAPGGSAVYSGSGLLAFSDIRNSLTVFDDSGQQLWKKSMTGMPAVFLDQRIVADKEGTSTKFYDAKTGDELFSIGPVDDVIATSRGIAVSVRSSSIDVNPGGYPKQRIDFYSYTGKKAWSIAEDRGYRLPNTGIIPSFTFNSSVRNSTSGVAIPIVYSEDKREIAAVDTTTGKIKWSQQMPMPPHNVPSLAGIGNLCIVSYSDPNQGARGVRVRDCNDETGAFVADTQETSHNDLVVADGDQTVIDGSLSATAYDAVTGGQVWHSDSDVGRITWVGDALYGASLGTVSRLS
jgi:outer membrane protein assembly factor BamB